MNKLKITITHLLLIQYNYCGQGLLPLLVLPAIIDRLHQGAGQP